MTTMTSSDKDDDRQKSADALEKTRRHPCYSHDAHTQYARMHLPVAPQCNISCNYCNRKYDCVNESRPGVTSEVLSPEKAKLKFEYVQSKIENLSVVGIAGPGDALANWAETKRSIQLIKAVSPDIIFCLSTNGLLLPDYAHEIVEAGVQHVTVTVNCLDPEIGAKIYRFVHYDGQTYQGTEAASLLLKNQLEGIAYLVSHGVLVKINIVMIKGINDEHIPAVVKKVKELGVFITNIMPLIPAPGSVFESYPQTSMKEVNELRDRCQLDIQQMRHCRQCRADAIGLLDEDRCAEFRESPDAPAPMASADCSVSSRQYKIAVTSKYGILVDQHFGHATEFLIYEGNEANFHLLEVRKAAKYCTGSTECDVEQSTRNSIIDLVADCDAVLTMRIGRSPQERLLQRGVMTVEYCYTVTAGLTHAAEQLVLRQTTSEQAHCEDGKECPG